MRIERDDLVVTGRGFAWHRENERFQIFRDVQVVLRQMRSRIETGPPDFGLAPKAGATTGKTP